MSLRYSYNAGDKTKNKKTPSAAHREQLNAH
jgi:hypothetical protein